MALKLQLVPFAFAPASRGFGKGQYVQGGERALTNGWYDVDVTLTKDQVDTFAFLAANYAEPPLAATARGLGFKVDVRTSGGGTVRAGVFLTTRDGQRWYQQGPVSLSEAGTVEAGFAFAGFTPFGLKNGAKRPRLRPEEIVRIEFGFGGYFGRAGEKIHFTVSPPHALEVVSAW